jgi:hypothetical protein
VELYKFGARISFRMSFSVTAATSSGAFTFIFSA